MEIPQKIKDFIDSSRIPRPPVTDLDEPLQLDSLSFIRLIAFLDNDCGIRLEEEELTADNFATLRQLGKLIASTPKVECAQEK
jgi:acyl carrier protein